MDIKTKRFVIWRVKHTEILIAKQDGGWKWAGGQVVRPSFQHFPNFINIAFKTRDALVDVINVDLENLGQKKLEKAYVYGISFFERIAATDIILRKDNLGWTLVASAIQSSTDLQAFSLLNHNKTPIRFEKRIQAIDFLAQKLKHL